MQDNIFNFNEPNEPPKTEHQNQEVPNATNDLLDVFSTNVNPEGKENQTPVDPLRDIFAQGS